MSRRPPSLKAALLAAALLLFAPAVHAGDRAEPPADAEAKPELGLMGTIPIYWGEVSGVAEVLSGEAAPHWARAQLEQDFRLRPLDRLDASALEGLSFLLLAQPRALTPPESVALDDWVRGGGHLLLFADPLLTGESRFPIGDRRRPQDVILLSPLLDHWGLQLQFVEDQPGDTVLLQTDGPPIPVRFPGRFAPMDGDRAETGADCTLSAADTLARCRIGDGTGIVLADAALLDLHGENPQARPAFGWLVAQAFAPGGIHAGNRVTIHAPKDKCGKSVDCMVNAGGDGEGGPSG